MQMTSEAISAKGRRTVVETVRSSKIPTNGQDSEVGEPRYLDNIGAGLTYNIRVSNTFFMGRIKF